MSKDRDIPPTRSMSMSPFRLPGSKRHLRKIAKEVREDMQRFIDLPEEENEGESIVADLITELLNETDVDELGHVLAGISIQNDNVVVVETERGDFLVTVTDLP